MNRSAPRALLWTRLHDAVWRTWRVKLGSPDITAHLERSADGREDHGATDYDSHTVWVNWNKPQHTWMSVVVHEFFHVATGESTLPNEDNVFTAIDTTLPPILRQFGFRLPRPPRVPRRWRKRARKPL